jgi:protein TonB
MARLCSTIVIALTAMTALPAGVRGQDEPVRLAPVEVRAPFVYFPPRYRQTPLPAYPTAAREQGLEGTAHFEVRVLADGRVGDVKLKQSSGAPILDEAAAKTIKTWTFEPGRRGPEPIESWVEIPVKFSLTAR